MKIFKMAIRQLLFRKQQTILTIIGITLGTAGTIILSGIMAGFQEFSISSLNEIEPQIKITAREKIKSASDFNNFLGKEKIIRWVRPPYGKTGTGKIENSRFWRKFLTDQKEVIAHAFQISTVAAFSFAGNQERGMVIGIEPERQKEINKLDKKIIEGKYGSLAQGSTNALIGVKLSRRLGLKIGDMLTVSIPSRNPVELKIVGIISSGYRFIDEENVYVSLSTGGLITGRPGEVAAILVKTSDPQNAKGIATRWSNLFSENIESWDQANEGLLGFFKIIKMAAFIVSLVIVMVASFGIYTILNMTVTHKKKEIAILRTMGYSQNQIIFLFTIQGALPGILGGLLGILAGYFGSQLVEMIPLKQQDGSSTKMTFAINHFLVSYDILIYLRAIIISFTTSVLAGFFPAKASNRVSPIDVIRGTV
ncbi:MAG: ABC transporter permease [Leptospiraceae bacterium]|nr:ABC transporter permease [Leptospiraceae bacterium]